MIRTRSATTIAAGVLCGMSFIACSGEPRAFGTDVSTASDHAAVDAPMLDTSQLDAGVDVELLEDVQPGSDVIELQDTPPVDSGPPAVSAIVYAHTSSELYAVDPTTFAITRIGGFRFPSDGLSHEMTDIAVTGAGQIVGITYNGLYTVDRATAACTRVAPLGTAFGMFNGLTFLPAATPGGTERLIAATRTGDYVEIDVATGATRSAGNYTAPYGSSGDIVSVAGAGTFATVVPGGFGGEEFLARVDEATGATTLIGPTGVVDTWGIGYWGGTLYGFTEAGEFVTISITTGRATVVSSAARSWWGAGVTTRASLTHL